MYDKRMAETWIISTILLTYLTSRETGKLLIPIKVNYTVFLFFHSFTSYFQVFKVFQHSVLVHNEGNAIPLKHPPSLETR